MALEIDRIFCPNCGHPAAPDVRFCSKCGFQLRAVTDLLVSGGVPTWERPEETGKKPISPRKRGLRQGAAMMLTSIVLIPVLAGLFEEVGAVAMVSLFLGGLARMIYALTLLEKEPQPQAPSVMSQVSQYVPPRFDPRKPQQEALPPPPASFMDQTPQRVNTAELVEPPSVTEHTTRLLENEQEPSER